MIIIIAEDGGAAGSPINPETDPVLVGEVHIDAGWRVLCPPERLALQVCLDTLIRHAALRGDVREGDGAGGVVSLAHLGVTPAQLCFITVFILHDLISSEVRGVAGGRAGLGLR